MEVSARGLSIVMTLAKQAETFVEMAGQNLLVSLLVKTKQKISAGGALIP